MGSHESIPDWSLENHVSGLKDAMGKRHVWREYSADKRILLPRGEDIFGLLRRQDRRKRERDKERYFEWLQKSVFFLG